MLKWVWPGNINKIYCWQARFLKWLADSICIAASTASIKLFVCWYRQIRIKKITE